MADSVDFAERPPRHSSMMYTSSRVYDSLPRHSSMATQQTRKPSAALTPPTHRHAPLPQLMTAKDLPQIPRQMADVAVPEPVAQPQREHRTSRLPAPTSVVSSNSDHSGLSESISKEPFAFHAQRASYSHLAPPTAQLYQATQPDGRPRPDQPYQSHSPIGPSPGISPSNRRQTMYFDTRRSNRDSYMSLETRYDKELDTEKESSSCWRSFAACFACCCCMELMLF